MKIALVPASNCLRSLRARDHIQDKKRTKPSLASQRRSLTALEQKRQQLQGDKP